MVVFFSKFDHCFRRHHCRNDHVMTDILVVDHAAYVHAPQSFAGAVAVDSRCRVERRGLLIPNSEYDHRSSVVGHLWSSIVGQSVYPLFLFPKSTIGRRLSTLLRSSIIGQSVVFFLFLI